VYLRTLPAPYDNSPRMPEVLGWSLVQCEVWKHSAAYALIHSNPRPCQYNVLVSVERSKITQYGSCRRRVRHDTVSINVHHCTPDTTRHDTTRQETPLQAIEAANHTSSPQRVAMYGAGPQAQASSVCTTLDEVHQHAHKTPSFGSTSAVQQGQRQLLEDDLLPGSPTGSCCCVP
jgi:hypothetical protein